MGGILNGAIYENDVWKFDGTSWSQLPDAPWTGRYSHSAVVYNDGTGDKIYVMGGSKNPSQGVFYNDVWKFDGVTWTQLPDAPWDPRSYAAAVVLGGKIYLMGGHRFSGWNLEDLNEVWTFNGTTWTQLPDAPWTPRIEFSSVTLGNKIYIFGGYHYLGAGAYNDVWTYNGALWTQLPDGLWSPRVNTGAAVFDGGNGEEAHLLGGGDFVVPSYWNEVWNFTGTTWMQKPNASWSPRGGFSPVSLCQ